MLCAIYKSPRKRDTYLYLNKRDAFDVIPKALSEMFGQPQFVMMLQLTEAKKLANADTSKVLTALAEQGFYLQLPPPEEDLHKQHLAGLKNKGAMIDA